jgi:hypothetical protein
MKCTQCGFKNEVTNRFCGQCGKELLAHPDSIAVTTLSELYGKDVDVLFFIENFTGKITGIVNPTEDQIGRYRDGVLQKITIQSGVNPANDETVGTILTFIRQSKEYLGEPYNENNYRNFPTTELKKEYLRLFERILKAKNKMPEAPKNPETAPKDIKK